MSKHTPGPWNKVSQYGNSEFRITAGEGGKVPVTNVCHGSDKANASLIAAAPDLLEALEHLLLYSNQGTLHPVASHNARKAIARAKGESQ